MVGHQELEQCLHRAFDATPGRLVGRRDRIDDHPVLDAMLARGEELVIDLDSAPRPSEAGQLHDTDATHSHRVHVGRVTEYGNRDCSRSRPFA